MAIDLQLDRYDTDAPAASVESKVKLTDATWAAQGKILVDSLRLTANGYDTAQLRYPYGVGMIHKGDTTKADYEPINLRNLFVRITIPQPAPLTNIVWVGYVVGDVDNRGGAENTATPPAEIWKIRTGEQVFSCVGLEWFLDRTQIDSAVHYPEKRIYRPMVFNDSTPQMDYQKRGNKSIPLAPTAQKPVFDDYYTQAGVSSTTWTAKDIVDYLLHWEGPTDGANPSPCIYRLSAASANYLSTWQPTVRTERQTVFAILNNLIIPQRALVWWLEYNDAQNIAEIVVDSTSKSVISIPNGSTVPANRNQNDWDYDQEPRVSPSILTKNMSGRYSKVVARGARRTSTFTLSFAAANLERNWDQASDGIAYNNAANQTPNYASLSPEDKGKRNDAYRREDLFHHVYQSFRIASNWDGQSNDGTSGGAKAFACPILSPSGEPLGEETLRLSGMKLLNKTPLLEGYDYAQDAGNPTKVSESQRPDFKSPFVILPVDDGKTKYQYAEKLRTANYATGSGDNDSFTPYSLYMSQQEPSFELRSANMPHTIAKADMATAEPTRTPGELDYTDMRVTLCGEWDAFCEVIAPDLAGDDFLQILTIDFGTQYRLDYLAANTIVNLNNGDPKTANGGIIRDDRQALTELATLAYQWYQEERAQLRVTVADVRDGIKVGYMITNIGTIGLAQAVNTVVTSISYDLINSSMVVETALVDLDFRLLV